MKEAGTAAHLISVIVPVYNKEAYLRECVDSILAQTYSPVEVILVDDESTDGSGRLCDEYARADARVRVLHQKNGGPTAACVAGMEKAQGGYYMFVDSDDYVEPDMLLEMAARLAGKKGEIVCCNHVLEKQRNTEHVRCSVEPGIYEGERLREKIKARLIGQESKAIPLSRCMKLCEKSLFAGNESYYDYSLRFGDDTNLMYPALLNSGRVVIMEDAFYYHYRYVEGSLVHSYDERLYENVRRLMEAVTRAAADKNAPDREGTVAREYCYMLLYVMKNELRSPGKDYRRRIQEIFRQEQVKNLIQSTPLPVTQRSNQLLYAGMRHPGGALLWVLRMIVRIYDRR